MIIRAPTEDAMSSQTAGGRKKAVEPEVAQPLSTALAHELAEGASTADMIARLVAHGWSAEDADHFVNYIDAARGFAGYIDSAGKASIESTGQPDEARWDFIIGIGALTIGAAGIYGTYVVGAPGVTYWLWSAPIVYGSYRLLRDVGGLFGAMTTRSRRKPR